MHLAGLCAGLSSVQSAQQYTPTCFYFKHGKVADLLCVYFIKTQFTSEASVPIFMENTAWTKPSNNNGFLHFFLAGLWMQTSLLGSQGDVMQGESRHMFSYFTNRGSTDRDEAACQRAGLSTNLYRSHRETGRSYSVTVGCCNILTFYTHDAKHWLGCGCQWYSGLPVGACWVSSSSVWSQPIYQCCSFYHRRITYKRPTVGQIQKNRHNCCYITQKPAVYYHIVFSAQREHDLDRRWQCQQECTEDKWCGVNVSVMHSSPRP